MPTCQSIHSTDVDTSAQDFRIGPIRDSTFAAAVVRSPPSQPPANVDLQTQAVRGRSVHGQHAFHSQLVHAPGAARRRCALGEPPKHAQSDISFQVHCREDVVGVDLLVSSSPAAQSAAPKVAIRRGTHELDLASEIDQARVQPPVAGAAHEPPRAPPPVARRDRVEQPTCEGIRRNRKESEGTRRNQKESERSTRSSRAAHARGGCRCRRRRSHQKPSEAIRSNQKQSEAIRSSARERRMPVPP